MKDSSAKKFKERTVMYKVGTTFKGCSYCGDVEIYIDEKGREKKRFTSGMQVFRSYHPKQVGWTYWCYECGAKDEQCWENAQDIGLDPVLGVRSVVRNIKNERRREAVRSEKVVVQRHPTRAGEIAKLEAEVKRLMSILKGEV